MRNLGEYHYRYRRDRRTRWRIAAWLTALCLVSLGSAMLASGEEKQRPPNRMEVLWGTPTPPEIFREGFCHGHVGHYTEWTIEYLTKDRLTGDLDRKGFPFYEDDDVPAEWRPTLADYRGSGFDRGHIAPASDSKASKRKMQDCFALSNMMPQAPKLNRGPWRLLEIHVRDIANEDDTEVWVVTLPLFVPDDDGVVHITTIGEHRVFAPTHCAKSILIRRGDMIELQSWKLPNVDDAPAFGECSVTVDEIEKDAALNFWSELPDDIEEVLESGEQNAAAWQQPPAARSSSTKENRTMDVVTECAERINSEFATRERKLLRSIWGQIISRCHDESHAAYGDYGARGITVCDRWRESFENFFTDIGPRPVGMTLDRRDNSAGYSPENCRWATMKQQSRNRRNNKVVEFNGERRCLAEWEEVTGLPQLAISKRLRAGWSVDEALTTPLNAIHHAPDTRDKTPIEWCGESRTIHEWSEIVGIPVKDIRQRLSRGWSLDDAMTREATRRRVGVKHPRKIAMTYQGVERHLKEWAEITGVKYQTIHARFMKGYSPEQVLGIIPIVRQITPHRRSSCALTDEQVAEARARRINGERVKDIAIELGVNYRTLAGAVKGDTYKHVKLAREPETADEADDDEGRET